MKKRILCMILLLAVIFGASAFNSTQAWFTVGENKHQNLNSGKLEYKISGSFKDFGDDAILPGEELIDTPLTIENHSGIDSQIRFCILYAKEPLSTLSKFNPNDKTELIDAVIDSNWVYSSDGWYYYNSTTYVFPPTETVTSSQSGEIQYPTLDAVSSIKYNGKKTGIEFSGENVELRITVQSKQAYYVNWNTIEQIILSKNED